MLENVKVLAGPQPDFVPDADSPPPVCREADIEGSVGELTVDDPVILAGLRQRICELDRAEHYGPDDDPRTYRATPTPATNISGRGPDY